MIDLNNIDDIFLYPGFTDMRLGLYGLRRHIIEIEDLNENTLYMFCGKKKNQIKIIHVDGNSVWLYQNKLLSGKFIWPEKGDKASLTKDQLRIIIQGLSLVTSIEKGSATIDLY